jgi:hypothetical protein
MRHHPHRIPHCDVNPPCCRLVVLRCGAITILGRNTLRQPSTGVTANSFRIASS